MATGYESSGYGGRGGEGYISSLFSIDATATGSGRRQHNGSPLGDGGQGGYGGYTINYGAGKMLGGGGGIGSAGITFGANGGTRAAAAEVSTPASSTRNRSLATAARAVRSLGAPESPACPAGGWCRR